MSHLAPPAPPVKARTILRAGVPPPWLRLSDNDAPTLPLAAIRMAASTAYREQAIKAEQIGPGTAGAVRNTGKIIFKFTTTGKVRASLVDSSLQQPPPLAPTHTPTQTPPLPLSEESLDTLDEQAVTDARGRASASVALRRRATEVVPVPVGGARYFLPASRCFRCSEEGHFASICPNISRQGFTGCFACGSEEQHLSESCDLDLCQACDEPGHQAAACPERVNFATDVSRTGRIDGYGRNLVSQLGAQKAVARIMGRQGENHYHLPAADVFGVHWCGICAAQLDGHHVCMGLHELVNVSCANCGLRGHAMCALSEQIAPPTCVQLHADVLPQGVKSAYEAEGFGEKPSLATFTLTHARRRDVRYSGLCFNCSSMLHTGWECNLPRVSRGDGAVATSAPLIVLPSIPVPMPMAASVSAPAAIGTRRSLIDDDVHPRKSPTTTTTATTTSSTSIAPQKELRPALSSRSLHASYLENDLNVRSPKREGRASSKATKGKKRGREEGVGVEDGVSLSAKSVTTGVEGVSPKRKRASLSATQIAWLEIGASLGLED